jgi:hypothetical protein
LNSEDGAEEMDHVLALLSEPLNRYILSVLAGVDPGAFAGPIEVLDADEDTQ